MPGEIVTVIEAYLVSNIANWQISLAKQIHRMLNPDVNKILDRGLAGRIFEYSDQVTLRHIGCFHEVVELPWMHVLLFQQGDYIRHAKQ